MAGLLGTISGKVTLNTRQAVAAYAALRAQNARTVYAMRGTGDSFIQAGQTMGVAGGAMVYAFAKVVNAAADFERKMDYFGAVTDTNSDKMQQLSKFTLQLAQDTIYSAGEIADGIIELGKAGVSAEMIMGGVGKAMANLGAAGDIPLAESGQIITSTIQQFGLAAKDAVGVTDLLAGAANASIADITDIGVSLKYVGGVANAAGLNFEDTATAISLLAKAGIRGSTAGTSLRQMIVSFAGATGPAEEALEKIGVLTADGSNKFYDMQGNLKPLNQVFQILQNHLDGYSNKEKLSTLRTIFNNRALSAASILTRDGAKGFREMNAAMSKVSAADVASKRLDNLSGDIEILRGNIETLMVTAGGPFQETLRGWVQALTKVVQAFSDLSPQTQKMIIQTIAITGVVLVAMAAVSIFVGTIFRFIASAKKFYAGIMFLLRIFSLYTPAVEGAAVATGLLTGPIGWVILALVALGAAFIIAYKKSETFRNFVNAIAGWFMSNVVGPIKDGVEAIIGAFTMLATDPGGAWNAFKDLVSTTLTTVVDWFKGLPGRIGSAMSGMAGSVGGAISRLVGYFLGLPGRVLGAITGFLGRLASLFTLSNVAYALGFAIGTMVRLWITLPGKILSIALSLVTGLFGLFARIGPRLAYFIGFAIGKVIGLWIRFNMKLFSLAASAVSGVIRFFTKLPGRIAAFIGAMVARSVQLFQTMRQELPHLAAAAVAGIINFIVTLPSRVGNLIQQMVGRSQQLFHSFVNNAKNAGTSMLNGLVNGIRNLPSTVSGILGDVISAFTGVITAGYNAAKNVASSLWKGFKDGIGMHSPSYIERAMWQINDTVKGEAKRLSKHTMDVQKMSKRMAGTQFSTGLASPSSQKYAKLARDHAINQKRAGSVMSASSTRPRPTDRSSSGGPGRARMVEGELKLHPSGHAFIRGIAQDTIDDNADYLDTIGGMG